MFVLAMMVTVGFLVAVLAWACCAASKAGDEAYEELNESIRRLHQVVASVTQTSGRSARMLHRRAQPFREILRDVPDIGETPRTGSP
jgi:outer membrane lipoprotein-sorting protein